MAQKGKSEITEADFYENLHNHLYEFPEKHRRILQRIFVTAANNLDKKKVQVKIDEKNKYCAAKAACKLRGITLQSVRTGLFDHEYLAIIKPVILLRQANRFKKAAGENSLAASIRAHFER